MIKMLFGCVLAAVVCVVWGSVSWIVLDWHSGTVHQFSDEAAVVAVLEKNTLADRSAVYMLPGRPAWSTPPSKEEAVAAWQASQRALRQGPFAYGFVRRGERTSSMSARRSYALARSLAASVLLALLLGSTAGLGYFRRVLFCTLAGLFTGLVSEVPLMIWFEAPLGHTLACLADHVSEWFLAGLVLAAFCPGRPLRAADGR